MNVYIVTLIILIFYLLLAWIAGAVLRLHGASLWVLRGCLALIGVIAAGLFLWFHHRIKTRGNNLALSQFAGIGEQIRILLHQAEQSLARGNQGSLAALPIVFVLGDRNSAKTSIMIHCGLEPELIAGHVLQDNDLVPTATINAWFARKTVFIEVGGPLASNQQLWSLILRYTRPKRISAAVGRGQQAPRAALVCLDCERLSSAPIPPLASRLKEMAQSLGAPFPVYVLFTKLDRVPHFAEYVSNITSEESVQILGATLPSGNVQGVFAQEESKRLARAFDQILYSLAEKRLDYLGRETVAQKMPGIYEFPRELRKMRNKIVQVMVDLSRPTQLSANPFLRGFYFSGVRAVVVNEAVSVPVAARAAATALGSGATRMFNIAEMAPSPAQNLPERTVQSRKVPEWAFLPQLFTAIVVGDPVASSSTRRSRRVDRLRWALLGSLALLLFFLGIAILVSFFNNRGLENEIAGAAEHLKSTATVGATVEVPGVEALRQLDQMRGSVEKLSRYQTDGPPMFYRLGLYVGDRIYPDARRLYFQNFRRLLLSPTQARMASFLSQPPGTRTSDDFQQMYTALKAYLITTSNHEHGSWAPLVSVLLDYSPAFKSADQASQDLIRRQFAFYAENLVAADPYGPENDASAVATARAYLKQFDALQAIYQAMLDDAGKGRKSLNFNRQFPQAAPFVVDNYEVPAAFSRDGFLIMQKLLQNPEKFRGEDWVLGGTATLNGPVESLRDALTKQYATDYSNHWRAYLKNAHVVVFGNLKDAAFKLSRLVANDSPLLQLLWLAKENTAVDIPDLKNPFDAVQTVARDSTLERLVGQGNQEYMSSLSTLQSAVQLAANAPPSPDPTLLNQAQQAAFNAGATVQRLGQHFTVDAEGGVDKNVTRLLREPIDVANQRIGSDMPDPAAAVCRTVNAVTSKRPFSPRSAQQASLQEVADLFRPQGTLWSSVQGKFGATIQRQGSIWVATGSSSQSQGFLVFLNRAQQFTDTLFPNSAPNVHLTYTLRRLPTSGIEQATLIIDGQTLTENGPAQQFIWQGRDSSVSLAVTIGGQKYSAESLQGPWALFEFFESADKWTGTNPATLDWPINVQVRIGGRQVSATSVPAVQYELNTQGSQVFKREFLNSLHCSSR